jgi:hypothetical protein
VLWTVGCNNHLNVHFYHHQYDYEHKYNDDDEYDNKYNNVYVNDYDRVVLEGDLTSRPSGRARHLPPALYWSNYS